MSSMDDYLQESGPTESSSESKLREAEESAGQSGEDSSDGEVDQARTAETGVNFTGDSFSSRVKGKSLKTKGKTKFSLNSVKKTGPLIAIVILVATLAVVLYIAQTVMPFALVNRLMEEYNTNGISAVLRADNILDVQLSYRFNTTFGLGDNQIEALKENDILPYEWGTGVVLAYKGQDGAWRYLASTSQKDTDPSSISASITGAFPDYEFGSFGGAKVVTVDEAFEDTAFKIPYTKASKTWRGGNSGWYDELADMGENIHGYQRSRWFKFRTKAITGTVKQAFNEIAKSPLSGSGSNTSTSMSTEDHVTTTTDTDGHETTTTTTSTDTDTDGSMVGQSKTAAKTQLIAKFVNAASNASELICAGVEAFIGVQTLISTYQRIQKLNLGSGFMEAVQSIQAGDTVSEPMHEYSNRLTETNPETGTNGMAAAGMDALFNETPIDSNDASVQSVNTEKILSNVANSQEDSIMKIFADVAGNANALLKAYEFCGYLTGGLAIVSAVVTVLSVIPIIGQGIAAISLTVKGVVKAAIKAAISAAAPIVAREVIKYAGNLLVQDLATEWLGEDLGNALVSASNLLLSSNHQIGGGSPGSKSKVKAFKRTQETVIAQEAEIERLTRSPLDISSPYTFLGSMVYSLVPMANSSGIGTTLKNVSSVMTNSLTKLLPTASAIAETSMVSLAKEGDCPTLDEIGVQADIYCNPIFISDVDTLDDENYIIPAYSGTFGDGSAEGYSPQKIIEIEEDWGYIKVQNESITILPDTNLVRYIKYCGERTSSFGLPDANISNTINAGSGSLADKLTDYIPLVSDIKTVVKSAQKIDNIPWVTGDACTASESNEYWCENKIHQRFIEDQRFYENTATEFNNPVVAFVKQDLEEHPLDNSFEGILARYSGMTKDDVIATLELMQGLDYIANYQPMERSESVAMAGASTEEEVIYFENIESDNMTTMAVEPKYVVYNTLRNRAVLV